jgi:DNA-binding GntR family transcriptional regulator
MVPYGSCGTLGRVPSGKTLSQERGISHNTAEKALDVLKREGLVRTAIGKGTYVIDR